MAFNMDPKKCPMPTQDPNVRNKNFKEVALGYTEEMAINEAKRCIHCKNKPCQTGCPVGTFYNSVGAKLAEGLDVLTASAKLNAQIAKVSGVVPQVAVVLGVCGGPSALSAANADVCIMAEGAELFFTAPFTSAAKGDKVADAGSAAAAATDHSSGRYRQPG